MQRFRILILLFSAMFLSTAHATAPLVCGTYSIVGIVEVRGPSATLVIFPGSLSETRLRLRASAADPRAGVSALMSIRAFSGAKVRVEGRIRKTVSDRSGELELLSFERAIGSEIKEGGAEALKLLEKIQCG
ncbi:MAG: hypothetical protein A2X94_09665 [Bdellovibrionales bacterium GWB1_55_8]|nr:MAG: hypothetical protein A2X94_09665 [Bdellovibrionales bacterium GWB1_55_8]